ncbi:MAG: DUF3800 domain-containing protein [Gemmatimonadaceae bacterium]
MADGLAERARGERLREAKFARLRRRDSGRARIVEALRSPALTSDTVRVAVYHKPFLVTTFMVDLLVEPLAYADGFDLYENRANLALSNLLQTVTGALCGPGSLHALHRRFVAAAMAKTLAAADTAVRAFYETIDLLRGRNTFRPFDGTLGMLAATRRVAPAWVGQCDPVALDPAVPAFSDLAAQWTAALSRPFEIAHDRSKPIEHQQTVLEQFMRPAGDTRVFGQPGIARAWPVLARGIEFRDSHDIPQIQVADLLAGAIAAVLGARVRPNAADPEDAAFVQGLAQTQISQIAFDPVWPSDVVDPARLGAGDRSASAAVNFVTDLARAAADLGNAR